MLVRSCNRHNKISQWRGNDLVSGLTDGKDEKSHRPKEKRLGVSIAVVELIAAFIELLPVVADGDCDANAYPLSNLAQVGFRIRLLRFG